MSGLELAAEVFCLIFLGGIIFFSGNTCFFGGAFSFFEEVALLLPDFSCDTLRCSCTNLTVITLFFSFGTSFFK